MDAEDDVVSSDGGVTTEGGAARGGGMTMADAEGSTVIRDGGVTTEGGAALGGGVMRPDDDDAACGVRSETVAAGSGGCDVVAEVAERRTSGGATTSKDDSGGETEMTWERKVNTLVTAMWAVVSMPRLRRALEAFVQAWRTNAD